ncbi:arginyltransferase [Planctomicrobium sp. SH527]|uniref:arginyltransferase n=1 Tax=Planctomicrobium sp. SH527 TaxID=3448123 RepID=UPI003F5C6DF1
MANRPLFQLVEPARQCSYLPDEAASLEYRGYQSLAPAELEEFISRGWRRFGAHLFRPACQSCVQCVPVRIDVNAFQPSKSQRRVLRRNEHVRVELTDATLSRDHIELYNTWHLDMTQRRDWPDNQTTPQDYGQNFLAGDFQSACELRYFDGDKLIGIGLIDLLPTSISSIYFYHAPEWRPAGPGTFSLLCEIDLARQLGLHYVYLGYWIANCPSMAYKNRFHPHEILPGRPGEGISPLWQLATDVDVD